MDALEESLPSPQRKYLKVQIISEIIDINEEEKINCLHFFNHDDVDGMPKKSKTKPALRLNDKVKIEGDWWMH